MIVCMSEAELSEIKSPQSLLFEKVTFFKLIDDMDPDRLIKL